MPNRMNTVSRSLIVLVTVIQAAGCQRLLSPTPNLYVHAEENPFADVPEAFRSNKVDVLFVTDRKPTGEKDGRVRYGYRRSSSVAWGSCVVEIGRNVSWENLVAASRTATRRGSLPLRIESVTARGRFPETPGPLVLVDGTIREADDYVAAKQAAVAAFHDELRRRLARTPHKKAVVYVHGFKNTFEDAAYRAAEIWHFLGREGVPIIYTWPAGHPGLIRGYTRDRESGEFTIFHLKEFLTALAACPDLDTVDLIAHSRGTDVLASGLRELKLHLTGRDREARDEYKIEHLVFAAPDVDLGVAQQRFVADPLQEICRDMTVYVRSKDLALGIAEWLFQTPARIGRLRPEKLDEAARQRVATLRGQHFIDARVAAGLVGHTYFVDNPATSSDLVLLLRYDRPPGAEHGRPLTEVAPGWYVLDQDYPQKAAPLPRARREN